MTEAEPVVEPVAPTKAKIITVRHTQPGYEQLRDHARGRGMSLSDWIRFACEQQYQFEIAEEGGSDG